MVWCGLARHAPAEEPWERALGVEQARRGGEHLRLCNLSYPTRPPKVYKS